MAKKIVVAMSGGVDSSTAAALLREHGHDVVGLSMQLWDYTRKESSSEDIGENRRSGTCCSIDDIYDARRVARFLGIPFYVVNFERAFERDVVQPFVESYLAGETPIPCVRCNTFMKFDQLLERAQQIGAGKLATGHYARVRHNPSTRRYELLRAKDLNKDQSYFLFELTQTQLARLAFPLGEFTKKEVRQIAERYRLPVHEKPDSQEICFIPGKDYGRFIEGYVSRASQESEGEAAPRLLASGEIVTQDGKVLGRHLGIHHFTIGQRKGLGVAVGEPLYVLQTDVQRNQVVVGRNRDLLKRGLVAEKVNWIAIDQLSGSLRVKAKIRNRHEAAPATVFSEKHGSVYVEFDEPQRAITPGQCAVFYDADTVVGGGWIKESR